MSLWCCVNLFFIIEDTMIIISSLHDKSPSDVSVIHPMVRNACVSSPSGSVCAITSLVPGLSLSFHSWHLEAFSVKPDRWSQSIVAE